MKAYLKNYIFYLIIISPFNSSFSQITGLYSGGNCLDQGLNCGWWYLKDDSSFVFVNQNKLDLIKNIGIGKWRITPDSVVQFEFKNYREMQLNSSRVEYLASTKKSYDSIYVTIKITNKNLKPIQYASILLTNTNKSFKTDFKGNCKFVIPANLTINYLTILKKIDNYYPLKIFLMSNYNYHEIKVTVPEIDSTSSFFVDESSIEYKITKKQMPNPFEIKKISDNNLLLRNALTRSREKQPLLRKEIEHLIHKIQQ